MSVKRFTLEDVARLSPSAQKEVQQQLYQAKALKETVDAHLWPSVKRGATSSVPRLRQDRNSLNKTEAAFFAYLKACWPNADVGSQRIRLKLGNGAWYKPDNDIIFPESGSVAFYEVKGFKREASAVRIKVAAHRFPRWTFFLVTRKKGQWKIEEVLP